jgi:hypothetical protein
MGPRHVRYTFVTPGKEASANEIIDIDQWEQGQSARVPVLSQYGRRLILTLLRLDALPRTSALLLQCLLWRAESGVPAREPRSDRRDPGRCHGHGKDTVSRPALFHTCVLYADLSHDLAICSMVAALIHTNRSATEPEPSTYADDPSYKASKSQSPEVTTSRRRTRRQLTLDTSFRPVAKKQAVESSDQESEDGEEDPAFDAADYEEGQERSKGKGKGNRYEGPTATLVVAPVSLLHQWESELKKSAKKNSLRMFSQYQSVVCSWISSS